MKIAIGADHAGFELKQKIRDHLQSQGFEVLDEGTNSPDSVDYPDYALKVSEDVTGHRADLGILVCGTGIGMSIAANKVPGIRAARVTSAKPTPSSAANTTTPTCLPWALASPPAIWRSALWTCG